MHISFIGPNKPCDGCGQSTPWRVAAGKSTYVICTSCMANAELACARDEDHRLCE